MGKINRDKVWNKYGKRCGYCGKELKLNEMQVDHIIPQSVRRKYPNGVVDSEYNLMPSCRRCNHYKRDENLEQFRYKIITLNERCASHYIGKVALDYGVIILNKFDGVFYFEKHGK